MLIIFSITVISVMNLQARQLHLNEVMASNQRTISDEDGDYEDWIELYNAGESPILLKGYGLSDNYDEPFRWVFPDTTLDAGDFMLIWASNKNRTEPGRPLHTNFAISSSGEEVLLTHPDGYLADELSPREIPTDLSAGRQPDGTGEWYYFEMPTPGAANTGVPLSGLLEPPSFSHEAGFYRNAFELEITHPMEGVTLYYTLDGSEPTQTSAVYEGPIQIYDRSSEPNTISLIPTNPITAGSRSWMPPDGPVRKGTVVRVRAEREGYLTELTTRTYFVFGTERNSYTFPVFSLSMNQDDLFDNDYGIYVPGINYDRNDDWSGNYYQSGPDWERNVHVELFEQDGGRVLNQEAGVRIHGGWTRRLPMKSLRLYARSIYDRENRFQYQFFPEQNDDTYNRIILRNSGQDFGRTLFKDALAQGLVSHLNVETQAYRPAVLFINGEYWGIHNIRERYDRFFFERVYNADPDHIDFLTGEKTVIEGDDIHYRNMLSFITENDLSDDNNFENVLKLLDADNFLDYFSLQIYYGNTDWPQNNIAYWRSKNEFNPDAPPGLDGRWRWVVYDLDRSLGHPEDASFNMIEWVTAERNFINREWPNRLLRNLLTNQAFKRDFINRMADHLNSAFTPERVIRMVNQFAAHLEPEIEEHIGRWGTPASINWWRGYVSGMRVFARERPSYLRSHIKAKFEIESLTEINIDPGTGRMGSVYLNSLHISPLTEGIGETDIPWKGVYFSGVEVRLRAEPKQGYRFRHWLIDGTTVVSEPDFYMLPETAESVKAVFERSGIDLLDPHDLSQTPYFFSGWSPDSEAGTYPKSMAFVYMNQREPDLNADIGGFTGGAYNLESRTRINGLNENGIAFVNTSNEEGNPGYPGTQLGGVLLVLNTTNVVNPEVMWRAGTIEANSKEYAWRLQFSPNPDEPFQDLTDPDGHPVEYIRNSESGHSDIIGPVSLPDELINQEKALLFWRYYHTGNQHDPESNQRSRLHLADIFVYDANKEIVDRHAISEGGYYFDRWPSDAPPGSFPPSMRFVFMDEANPGLTSGPIGNTWGAYDLSGGTAIRGLYEKGFSFYNGVSGADQTEFPELRLGGAIVTLNLENSGGTNVEWHAGTIREGSYRYGLRLQYRISQDDPFKDLPDVRGNPVEYMGDFGAGHQEMIGPILLPPHTDGEPFVELLWRYYNTGEKTFANDFGAAELNISHIRVTSLPLLGSEPGLPLEFRLYQNYPNPFYPESTIQYDLPEAQQILIDLYTIHGKRVARLADHHLQAGRHSTVIDASGLASGIYLLRFLSEDYSETIRLSIIK